MGYCAGAKRPIPANGTEAVTETPQEKTRRGPRALIYALLVIAAAAVFLWKPYRTSQLLAVAGEHLKAEQWEQADRILQEAEELSPENADVQFWRARTARKLGNVAADPRDALLDILGADRLVGAFCG